MAVVSAVGSALSLATLRETRLRLRTWWGRSLVAAIATAYAFVSMLLGQMLVLARLSGPYYIRILPGNGTQWWNYPGILVVESWGVLQLPFFPSIAMLLVSLGVGLGASIGILLALSLLRRTKYSDRRAAAAGAAAGVGPAITGLATLGACCCTTCLSTAGVALVAAASGTSLYNLLLNNWYIGAFQLAVVYVALMAQERTLRLTSDNCPVPPPMDRRFLAGAILRLGLLIAGITWSLAMFIEWSDTPPLAATAPLWFHWVFEHQLLSGTAVAAGLFPAEFAGVVRRAASRLGGRTWRIALAVAGISWGTWVPPALVGMGLGGFLNELFGFLSFPLGLGAVSPDATLGVALYFHWAFQHLLLSGFALSVALSPSAATAPLLWTVSGGRPRAVGPERGPRLPSGIGQPRAPTPTAPPIANPSPDLFVAGPGESAAGPVPRGSSTYRGPRHV